MALATVGLNTAIWNNNLRSLLLIAFYPFILMAMVWAVAALYGLSLGYGTGAGGAQGAQFAARFGTGLVLRIWPTILTVVAIWFLISLLFHANMIRMLSKAAPVTRAQEPQLYNLLENLCISRGITMPSLQIVETDARNAFSSGISKGNYSVTVTRGLMQALQPDELEAVLAHELTHILNNDVRLLIVSIIFVGMLGFAAQLLWSQIRWGFFFGGRRRDNGMQIILFLMAVEAVLWIGYMTTLFTRFAVARHRESMADEGAIQLTKNPDAMMRALLRIESHDRIPHASPDIAQMCVVNSRPFLGLFDDHPPIPVRVAHIAAITGAPVPVLADTTAPAADVLPASGRHNPWG